MANKDYILGLDLKKLRADAQAAKREIGGISPSVDKEAMRINSSFQSIGKTVAGVGTVISAGLAIDALTREVITFSQTFNKSMLEVATISQTVTDNMESFKSEILDLTKEVPIQADEAAKALYQIVSAGHDGAAGMNVLEVASKAAVGGVTDTATAADAITTVLNAYKLSADDAEIVSDRLFTTVRLGKTDMTQLAGKIATVAPVAASFGIEMEQVLSAVATLTASGTPTAEAMTQIRASILASSKVLGDGYYNTHTFQEGLAEIASRAGGSHAKLRELVPEIEALNGVLGMTGINAATSAKHLDEFSRASGASEAAYQKMLEDSQAQMTLFKNNLMSMLSGVGESATEVMGSVAKSLNKALDSGQIEQYAKILGGLAVTFGTYKTAVMATTAVKQIMHTLNRKVQAQMVIERALRKGASMDMIQEAARTKVLMVAKQGLARSIKATTAAMLANPYALAAAAVAALGAGIYLLATRADEATRDMREMKSSLDEAKSSIDEISGEIDKYDSKAKGIRKLTDEYEELKKKTSLTKDESDRLKTILNLLSSAYPDATTAVNQYGAAIEINTGKITRAIDAERKLLVLRNADKIDDIADDAGDAFSNYKKYQGTANYHKNNMQGDVKAVNEYNNLDERGKKAYAKLAKGAMERVQYNTSEMQKNQANADESLDFFYAYIKELERLSMTSEEIADRIASESGEKITAGNINWVKKVVEERNKITKTIEEEGKDKDKPKGGGIGEDEDKLIKGSIAYYEEKIKKAKELRSTLTDASDIDGVDIKIEGYEANIKALNAESEARKQAIEDEKKRIEEEKKQEEDRKKALADKLEAFKTFAERYAQAEKEHNERNSFISKKGGDKQDYDSEDRRYEEDIETINEEVLNSIDTYEELAAEITAKNIDQIIDLVQGAKKAMLQVSGGKETKQIKALSTELDTLAKKKEEFANNSDTKGRSLKEWQDMEKQLNDCNNSFQEIGQSVGGVAGEIIGTAGSIVGSTISMVSSISQLVDISINGTKAAAAGGTKAIQAVETASVILAVISAVIQVATKIASLFKGNKEAEEKHQKALQEATQRTLDMQYAYNAALREEAVLLAERGTAFGGSDYAVMIANQKKYSEGVKDLKDMMKGDLSDYHLFSAVESFFGMDTTNSTKELEQYKKGIEELGNIKIVTGSKKVKSGLFGWGRKQVDVTQSILDLYPDLIDAEGMLNAIKVQEILNTQKLSEEDKKRLEAFLEAQEGINEAMDAMNDYYQNIFGDLGMSAGEQFAENFANGTSGMGDDLVEMMNNLVIDAANAIHIDPILQAQQEKIKAINADSSLSTEERAKKIQDLAKQTAALIAATEEEYKDSLEEMDYDVETKRESSSSEGIANASQDSVDELNGRATAIQGQSYDSMMSLRAISTEIQALRGNSGSILSTVMGIKGDTANLSPMRVDIGFLKEDMSSMKRTLANIETKGIKVKV